MRGDLDDLDELPTERDPVVRMPRRMAAQPSPPRGVSLRLMALVGLGFAALGAGIGVLGIGIVVATLGRPASPPPSRAVVVAAFDAGPPPSFELDRDAAVLAPAPPGAAEYEVVQQAIGRGRTLATALRAVGVEVAEGPRVIRALRRLVPMRALRPADRVVALRDPSSHALLRVEFRRSATQVWAAVRSSDGQWYGEAVHLVLSTARVGAGFRVGGDVVQSLRDAGLHPELLPRLAEALAALDLAPRLVGGDVVRVVVEEERLNDAHQRYVALLAVDLRGPRVRRRAFWSEAARDWYDPEGFTAERGALRAPVAGARLGARFDPARVHPVTRAPRPHLGVDFVAAAGTPVLAAAEGIVLSASPAGASGNLVRLSHRALGIETGYAHLARFAPGLRAGRRVRARELIGYVGSTGQSRAPHLHVTVRRGAQLVDPLGVFAARQPLPAAFRESFAALAANLGASLDAVPVDGEAIAAPPRPPPAVSAPPRADDPPTEPDPEGYDVEAPS